jgi:hypothetical protein
MRPDTDEATGSESGTTQVSHANTELTVTEVAGEQPRRDPKKLSCAVFPN